MATSRRGDSYARYALGLLLLVYTFNFIDRVILGILVPPIKAELHLTDTELGLLGGTAFALFYTALGVPIGWLADRFNRVWIMTIALALWSAFSGASGLAQNFFQLFLARLGVGIGEAGGVAPAYSLISDYFPSARRARALAIYSFGIPIGSAAGLLFGGLVASRVNWRAAFLVVGALGLMLAPLFRYAMHEPVRGGLDTPAAVRRTPSLRDVVGVLARKTSFWCLSFGGASSSIMGYGTLFWLPSFYVRSYHYTLVQVSWYLGALILGGGVSGIWLGGWLADRLGARSRAAYALVPSIAFLLCVPLYALGVLAPPSHLSLLIFLVPIALSLAWLGPTLSAIQHLVPPDMRALASSLFLFINNLVGLGLGTLVIGRLSDHFIARYGSESLRYAILSGTGFYMISAVLFALAARRLAREWIVTGRADIGY
ncbi:MAG: MFS transporter [Steroidobacteraceae bacterium]|jgi:MFS family permease